MAAAVLLSACQERQTVAEGDLPTLRIGVGVGASALGGGLSVLTEMLYAEPLVAVDTSGRPVARLAEHWGWEDNGRALRIRLRKGVQLHDGRILTADLAREFLQARINSLRKEEHRGAFDHVSEIQLVGNETLVVRLVKPDAFLIAEFNNAYIVDPKAPDIGTGPFRLVSRKPVKAIRFAEYHRGAPSVGGVEITTYPGQRAAWAALMRDEVDAVQEVTRDSVEFIQRSTGLHTFSSLRPYFWALTFNLRHPQLQSPDIRRAISHAVNPEEIVGNVLRGYSTVAVDPVWPLFWAYPKGESARTHNVAEAQRLLDRVHGGSKKPRLRFRCLFYDEDPQFERMALMLQRQLNEVGVELDLQPASLQEMKGKLGAGDFDSFLLLTHSGRALDWTYRFWHSPGPGDKPLQSTGYVGVDQALDQLRRSYTEPEIRDGVLELRRRFHDDPPAVFIAWQRVTRAVSARFDVSEADKQDVFANIWQWKPASHPE